MCGSSPPEAARAGRAAAAEEDPGIGEGRLEAAPADVPAAAVAEAATKAVAAAERAESIWRRMAAPARTCGDSQPPAARASAHVQ
ncbi:hypothetical protein CLOM_g23752 [Closterium sp. NIES-68]|nr:hypothetical protein CLOM_g23752 [Closterium sp. NIES-68]GJP72555.1 hypothetical protein CLOP_g3273 [Closterium sp. NIES-67]GJP79936.1 hypothetical protein CLOP_g10150 [Closterium sp. NIES-67]